MENFTVTNDFPEKGVDFYDVGPLLANPKNLKETIETMAYHIPPQTTKIVAVDSRGFIFGSLLANHLQLPLILCRKKGKLSGELYSTEPYSMEYGTSNEKSLHIQKHMIDKNDQVAIIDDVLATGGTLESVIKLIQSENIIVTSVICLLQLIHLDGIKRISELTKLYSHFTVDAAKRIYRTDGATDLGINYQIVPYVPQIIYNPRRQIKQDKRAIVISHPGSEEIAAAICFKYPWSFRASVVDWGKFPDGWSNIKFESSETLQNRDIVFVMCLQKMELVLEQLCLLVALCRQFARSVTIVVPYFGPGTMERVTVEGELATAEPMMKLLSAPLPLTSGGLPALCLIDIHDIRERFYPTDNVTVKMLSASNIMINAILEKEHLRNVVIVFPDEGAYKRFGHLLVDFPVITCMKMRKKDERKIIISSSYRLPEDKPIEKVLIWDDLVHTGGTLIECAKALRAEYDTIKNVFVFVTHSIFDRGSHVKFMEKECPIDHIYTTNSNPLVSKILCLYPQKITVFGIDDCLISFLQSRIVHIESVDKHFPKYEISSNSILKVGAAQDAFNSCFIGHDCKSGVSEQPFGIEETTRGLRNRHLELRQRRLGGDSSEYTEIVLVSIEHGLIWKDDELCDVAFVKVDYMNRIKNFHSECSMQKTWAIVPKEHVDGYLTARNDDPDLTYGLYVRENIDPTIDHKNWNGNRRAFLTEILTTCKYSVLIGPRTSLAQGASPLEI